MPIHSIVRCAVLLLAVLASAASDQGGDDDSSAPMCRKGCPCGNACIDCNDTCHKEDIGGMTDEMPDAAAGR